MNPITRRLTREALLSLLVPAALVALPLLGFLYALDAHRHEHDSTHDSVAQQALLPRVPTVIGGGSSEHAGMVVLRTAPGSDDATPGGVDEREP